MAHTVARVRIADFDQFIETFSTRGLNKRREHGCRGVRVFRSSDDPNQLINVFDWDRADVEAFMADPEVPAIMAEAGLEAPPEFTFVELAAELEA
jgi:quinol monooxygenase YgiN